VVLDAPVQIGEVCVDVVDDLDLAFGLFKEHPGRACEHLAVGLVIRHPLDDPVGQAALAAQPCQWAFQLRHHGSLLDDAHGVLAWGSGRCDQRHRLSSGSGTRSAGT
jgi:hypothetical protein